MTANHLLDLFMLTESTAVFYHYCFHLPGKILSVLSLSITEQQFWHINERIEWAPLEVERFAFLKSIESKPFFTSTRIAWIASQIIYDLFKGKPVIYQQ